MNELTQERSRIHASILRSAFAAYQIPRNMSSIVTQNLEDTFSSQQQLTVAKRSVWCFLRLKKIQAKLKASPVGFVRRNLEAKYVSTNTTMII